MKKLRTLVQLNSIPLSIVHMIVFIGLLRGNMPPRWMILYCIISTAYFMLVLFVFLGYCMSKYEKEQKKKEDQK